ncbi:MAG: ABC transporter substrate-binding protein [Actinomycetota bacterium]|nr:ABC transporter substrate-binding protein [Actinomycetota bacterium]
MRVRRSWAAGKLLALVLTACRANPSSTGLGVGALQDDAITVASYDFPESVVLAEIYAQALGSNGYRVIRQFDIGPRELVDPALERGLVELVPEYAGSALTFLGATAADASDPVAVHRTLARAFEARGIAALDAAPAEDQNGFAVTSQTASTYDLVRLSDLAPIAGELTLGGPPECPQRPLCAGGLASTYGLRFERFQPLDASGPLTTDALKAGSVNVALMFTTDGDINTEGFVLLQDDRHLQPAENVTPVVNAEVVQRFGDHVVGVIDAVSRELTTADLRSLNAAVAGGQTPQQAAATWLDAHGLGRPE